MFVRRFFLALTGVWIVRGFLRHKRGTQREIDDIYLTFQQVSFSWRIKVQWNLCKFCFSRREALFPAAATVRLYTSDQPKRTKRARWQCALYMNKWCRLDAILIDLHASYIPVSKYLTTIVSEFLLDDLVGNISIKIRSEVKHIPPHTDVSIRQ